MIKFVSFSGPDGVGKTSTIAALHKLTNYKYVIYDRDIPDQLCYAKLANRCYDQELEEYMNNNDNQLYVIINSDVDTIKHRMALRNDFIVPEHTTLEQAITYFQKYKQTSQKNVLYVDNKNLSIDEVVQLVINKLQGLEK